MPISTIGSAGQSAYVPQASQQPSDSTSSAATPPSSTPATASAPTSVTTATPPQGAAAKPDLDAPAASPPPESNIKINPDGTTGPLHKHTHSTQSVHA